MLFILRDLRLFFKELSFCQEIFHILEYLPKLSLGDRCPCDKNNMSILFYVIQISSVCLAKPPAQAIPHDAVANLFADGKADAKSAVSAGQIHQNQPLGGE